MPETELSIVVLCYRSEEAIVPFARQVNDIAASLTASYEVVLVGNYIEGSKDKTKQLVLDLATKNDRFKAIAKPKKGMMGWDMIEGLRASSGKYICVIDGDGQFPVDSIVKCYQKIKTGNYDLVKTYREVRQDGFYRKVVSRSYNILFSILFPGLKSMDVNSKPKIISRKALDQMKLSSTDWFIDAEIMLNVRKLELRFHEFPITFRDNENRASFVKPSAIFEFIRNMFTYWMKER